MVTMNKHYRLKRMEEVSFTLEELTVRKKWPMGNTPRGASERGRRILEEWKDCVEQSRKIDTGDIRKYWNEFY